MSTPISGNSQPDDLQATIDRILSQQVSFGEQPQAEQPSVVESVNEGRNAMLRGRSRNSKRNLKSLPRILLSRLNRRFHMSRSRILNRPRQLQSVTSGSI